MFEQFKNPDRKTYNGVAAMAAVTGIPPAEMAWMAKRIQALVKAGTPRAQITLMVKEEAKARPWEQKP
ncbi:hypothetical protein [Comamonas sediminis]|uniref:Uncharacterized protein n=1 Tax=Comamonas sediminis TaxID=1783360 RepID=A0ABV4B947_9BURK